MWGFYRKRLKRVAGWGNSYGNYNHSFKCGCWVDHVFIDSKNPSPKNNRTVVVHPGIKHTGKFFKTRWK